MKTTNTGNLLALIFDFSSNSSAQPSLLDIYSFHKTEGMRIMAVVALVESGDAERVKTVENKLYKQRTEKVRDYVIAALKDY